MNDKTILEQTPVEKTETVTLRASHTHDGRDYKAGDKLTVPPRVARWLREHGVIG